MVRHWFTSSGDSMDGGRCGGGTDRCSPPPRYGYQKTPTLSSSFRASLLVPRSAKGVLRYFIETPWKGVGRQFGLGATFPNALAPRKPGKDLRGALRIGVVAVTECSV